MLSLISVILIAGNILSGQPMDRNGSKNEYVGKLPEIVITGQAGPEVGMLDEVVITEPRYVGEDIAYSGMLPEIVSTAKRQYTRPVLTFIRMVEHKMPMRVTNLLFVTRLDARNTGYLN